MVSLTSTLIFAVAYASKVLASESFQLAVPVPCTGDALILASQHANSTEDGSLEKRQGCGFQGTFYDSPNCSGGFFSKCTGGSVGCVLTNSILAFGYQSVFVSDTSCDLRIWNGGCNDGFSFGIPKGSQPNICWGGFGTAHGYSVQC
ncbi:hypothetical protein TARUN_999 [Trichoderma arundinaceum]|uniref:Uncharacterized protein n=1 Tax=Trichoderma arundinaceum TaxID=490622 RepID=A0A395NYN7_TRIAR|nr:hypothetical protein TARUN_999 [Trichoderma arundinaceum]